jgi:hypothetical protein
MSRYQEVTSLCQYETGKEHSACVLGIMLLCSQTIYSSPVLYHFNDATSISICQRGGGGLSGVGITKFDDQIPECDFQVMNNLNSVLSMLGIVLYQNSVYFEKILNTKPLTLSARLQYLSLIKTSALFSMQIISFYRHLFSPEASLLNKRLMLSSSFRCDKIYKYETCNFGHTLLCYLSQT